MQLFDHSCYARLVTPYHDENILRIEPQAHEVQNDLDVGHALDPRAHFVLTLHDQDPVTFQNPFGLDGRLHVKLKYRVMPFISERGRPVAVRVMVAERGMRPVASKGIIASEKTLHVGWVEHNAVELAVAIGQMSAIDP